MTCPLSQTEWQHNWEGELSTVQMLSESDGLTGLANRRKFDMVWKDEWQRALRQGLPLAIAMLDVDQFKLYNDHYGHQAGDACLKRVAHAMDALTQRSGELAARYGGEEFVLILPGVSCEEACEVAEKIRAAVEEAGISHAMSTLVGVVTVSIGVVWRVPQPGDDAESLVQEADVALYQAKHEGRNRVFLARL